MYLIQLGILPDCTKYYYCNTAHDVAYHSKAAEPLDGRQVVLDK